MADSFQGGGGFIGNPGSKGGPLVQPFFGGGGGGRYGTAYGGGKGGYQRDRPPRRRRLDEPEGGGRPTPNWHGPGGYINPYSDIPGFEDYQHPLLRVRGDQIGKVGIPGYPGAIGFPSHERVQQISEAMRAFQGIPARAPRNVGRGIDVGNSGDMLKRLLRERLGLAVA